MFAHNSKIKGNIKKHYIVDPPLFGIINSNKLLFYHKKNETEKIKQKSGLFFIGINITLFKVYMGGESIKSLVLLK